MTKFPINLASHFKENVESDEVMRQEGGDGWAGSQFLLNQPGQDRALLINPQEEASVGQKQQQKPD